MPVPGAGLNEDSPNLQTNNNLTFTLFFLSVLFPIENAQYCHKIFTISLCTNIHNDSRGRVNVLGANNIGHFEEKVYINICLILNGYRHRVL
jgi:hypothetical protein